ncbi:Transmembrane protein 107, partial [Geodia barretti]
TFLQNQNGTRAAAALYLEHARSRATKVRRAESSMPGRRMVHHAVVPARFLSLTAHLVLTIMLYWSREPHISACTSADADESSSEYKRKDLQYIPINGVLSGEVAAMSAGCCWLSRSLCSAQL